MLLLDETARDECVMAWMNEAMLCATTTQGSTSESTVCKFGYMNHAIELQCNTKFYYRINCPFQGNRAMIYKKEIRYGEGEYVRAYQHLAVLQ